VDVEPVCTYVSMYEHANLQCTCVRCKVVY
jgi:hypothetical protein